MNELLRKFITDDTLKNTTNSIKDYVDDRISDSELQAKALNGKKQVIAQYLLEIHDMAISDHFSIIGTAEEATTLSIWPDSAYEVIDCSIAKDSLSDSELRKLIIKYENGLQETLTIPSEGFTQRLYTQKITTIGEKNVSLEDDNGLLLVVYGPEYANANENGRIYRQRTVYHVPRGLDEDYGISISKPTGENQYYNITGKNIPYNHILCALTSDSPSNGELKFQYIQQLHINNGSGISSLFQELDTKYSVITIKSKNPWVSRLSLPLTDNEPNGATGEWASAFGGASSAQGKRSFACGTNTVAKADYSFAAGNNGITLGKDSFTSGYNTLAKGNQSFAIGYGSAAIGAQSMVLGNGCEAHGPQSFAGGQMSSTNPTALRSFAFGDHVKAEYNDQFVVGRYNKSLGQSCLFAVGVGTETTKLTGFEVRTDGAYALGVKLVNRTELTNLETILTQSIANTTNKLSESINNVYNTNRKSLTSTKALEVNNIANLQSLKLTSTVTLNYLYKNNFITPYDSFSQIILSYNSNTTVHIGQLAMTEIETNIDVLKTLNLEGIYIKFKTPTTPISDDLIKITFTTNGNTQILNTRLKAINLKTQHYYMLVVDFGKNPAEMGDSKVYQAQVSYLVDFEESIEWDRSKQSNHPAQIYYPNFIMLPHKGRIGKSYEDQFSASWEVSETYLGYHGINANNEHYLKIGDTTLTETQLKQIIAQL